MVLGFDLNEPSDSGLGPSLHFLGLIKLLDVLTEAMKLLIVPS